MRCVWQSALPGSPPPEGRRDLGATLPLPRAGCGRLSPAYDFIRLWLRYAPLLHA
jgi:hypothetical protein